MKAAGFDGMDEVSLHRLIWRQVALPEHLVDKLTISDDVSISEYRYALNDSVGVCAGVCFIGTEFKELQYYYPYFDSKKISSDDICMMERYTFSENFAGVLDANSLGITLIFFVNNPLYFRTLSTNGLMDDSSEFHGVYLSAFANEGMVILPVEGGEDPGDADYRFADEAFIAGDDRDALVDAALSGDADALEELTESDIMSMRELTDRIESEDLYSVVEQSFMPCGIECDQYSIIGVIRAVRSDVNSLTDEKLWLMDLSCNDVDFALCMRQADLMGEPAIGRRIKCRLWMQGRVDPKTKSGQK